MPMPVLEVVSPTQLGVLISATAAIGLAGTVEVPPFRALLVVPHTRVVHLCSNESQM